MKLISYKLLQLTFIVILFTSCSKELQRINTNPNNLENPDPTTLLSNTIVTEFYNNSNLAWTLGNGYGQYMVFNLEYNNSQTRYLPITNEPYWIAMYEAARDANTLITIGQNQKNALLQAIAITLRTYAFAQLTELWGDIPFKQALQGASGTYTPGYDNQQIVYTDPQIGILPSLRTADSLLKANPAGLVGGDMLFNANVMSWRRFINALRLRYLLRVSSKINVSAEMQSIVNDGAIMQNASQSAALNLPATLPYNFVGMTERLGDFNARFMDSTLYSAYVSTGDSARMVNYFAPNANTQPGSAFQFSNYGGLPLVTSGTASQTSIASNFNTTLRAGSNANLIKARIITYAEQQFILAEAVLRGFINGNAQSYYNSAVIAAYAEIGIDGNTANNYLSHAAVAFNNNSISSALQQIITQKWLLNINNGFEGWIEYRRTGYPVFASGGAANLNNGNIPTRFLYPTTEQTINSKNYNAEIQLMGGTESTNYKAWWEK